jgi:hypothetical protein
MKSCGADQAGSLKFIFSSCVAGEKQPVRLFADQLGLETRQ